MTYWKYAIIKRGKEDFGIHEVYFNKKGTIQYTTEETIFLNGKTPDYLIRMLELMLNDLKDGKYYDYKTVIGSKLTDAKS